MKKKVLIVTLNDYVVYQPTILNLYDALQPFFETAIISFEPEYISTRKDETRNIIYLRTNPFFKELFQKTDFILSKAVRLGRKLFPGMAYRYLYYNFYLPKVLYKNLKNHKADIVIAVDIPALYVTQKIFSDAHFLSLEIDVKDPFFPKINTNRIRSVFIQNKIRFDHLFPEKSLKTFFIQNSPTIWGKDTGHYERKGLVWAGTIIERFGVLDCLEFINQYPQYSLVLKGGGDRKTLKKINKRYSHLIETGRVDINQNYLPGEKFIDFLSRYRIGFCFYSWELIRSSFNYQTAPSGKLFMYLAAGTPVIASNIPAFEFVIEFGAGVLVNDYHPTTIHEAIVRIEADYEKYSEQCYAAARHFSFDKMVEPYIEFLLTSP